MTQIQNDARNEKLPKSKGFEFRVTSNQSKDSRPKKEVLYI